MPTRFTRATAATADRTGAREAAAPRRRRAAEAREGKPPPRGDREPASSGGPSDRGESLGGEPRHRHRSALGSYLGCHWRRRSYLWPGSRSPCRHPSRRTATIPAVFHSAPPRGIHHNIVGRTAASCRHALQATENRDVARIGSVCQGAGGGGFRRVSSNFQVGGRAILDIETRGGFLGEALVILLVKNKLRGCTNNPGPRPGSAPGRAARTSGPCVTERRPETRRRSS